MGADGIPGFSTAMAQAGAAGWTPVLPAQHGMILNNMRFPDDGVDVLQVTLDWTSPLEREPFEAAWHRAVRRHPVLRTAFWLDNGRGLVQVVDPDASIDIRWRDLPQPPASGPDRPFESFLRADRRERFDPAWGTARALDDPAPGRASRQAWNRCPGAPRGADLPPRAAGRTLGTAACRRDIRRVRRGPRRPRRARSAAAPVRPVRAVVAHDCNGSLRAVLDGLPGRYRQLLRPLPGYLRGHVAGTAESATIGNRALAVPT